MNSDIERLAKAIHQELKDTDWKRWLFSGNEANAFNPPTGWCRCVGHAKSILKRMEEDREHL